MPKKYLVEDELTKDFTWSDFIRAVWFFLEKERGKFLFWTITLFLIYFYELVPSYIVGRMVDFFTVYKPGQPLDFFYGCLLVLSLSWCVVALVRLTGKNKVIDVTDEISYRGRIRGFERLLEYSIAWHERENTGNKIERIQAGMRGMKDAIRTISQKVLPIIAGLSGVLLFFLWQNIWLCLFLTFYLVFFFGIQIGFEKRILKLIVRLNATTEQSSGKYYEALSNILTIKTQGANATFQHKVSEQELKVKELNFQIRRLGFTKWKAFQIFNGVSIFFFLWIVGLGVLSQSISLGSVFIYFQYLMNVSKHAGDSGDFVDQLLENKSAVARMMPIYQVNENLAVGNLSFPDDWKKLTVRNGIFTYRKDAKEFHLQDIHFDIPRGGKVGIVGKSGSGKSTLVKLFLGLYRFEQGQYTIDDTSFYDIKHVDVTDKMAIVLQESELFNFSLKDNITLMREVPFEVLDTAIEVAQLRDVVAKIPDGLETLIGEKGYRVSGGERQRIAIARAICKQPDILVLDEATSHLDSTTESRVQESLEKYLQDTTLIIIAHRFSTLKNVDRIYVFDQGRIVEEGRFADLMQNKDSIFAELYTKQMKGVQL